MLNHSSKTQSRSFSLEQVLLLIACFAMFAPLQMQVSVAQDGAVLFVSTQISPPSPPQAPDQEKAEVALEDEMFESLSDAEVSAGEPDEAAAMASADFSNDADDEQVSLDSDDVVELSVDPSGRTMLPEGLPAWIGKSSDYSTEVHRLFVGSTPVSNEEDVDEALGDMLVATVNNYIDQEVFEELGASESIGITEGYIRRNLINDPQGYLVKLQTSVEPMYQKWVTLEITEVQREYFHGKRREAVQRSRLVPLGLGLFGVLGLVGASHMLMRRKHGLASAQPFNAIGEAGAALHANEAAAVASKNSGGGILAALVAVVFTFGVMGVLAVLMYAGVSRQAEFHEFQEVQKLEAHQMDAVMKAANSAIMEAESLSEQARKEVESKQESVTIIQSGQKIHIKSR